MSIAATTTGNTTDQAVTRRLHDILARPDLPAFSEHIQQILRLAGDDSSSIRSVTNVILREVSISLKLLRTANSPRYNRSGRPIVSVSHAASLLGMQGIRDLTASILLFQHFREKSPGLRELLLLSLMTANHSRECAHSLDYPRMEEAYLCGMFRNLGEVLIACYYPREYAAILHDRRFGNLSDRMASRKVLRFAYEDLGRAMAEHWGLPEVVRDCQREIIPGKARIPANARDFLPTVTTFSKELTDCAYRGDPASSRQRVTALRELFAASLGMTPELLEKVMTEGLAETADTSNLLHIPVDSLRLERQLEAALRIPIEAEPAKSEEEFDRIGELRGRIEAGSSWDLNEVLMGLLEEAFRSGPFDQVLFGLLDPPMNTIHGRLGLGENIDSLLERFRFPLSLRGGPVALAILRKHDLFAFSQGETRFDHSAFARTLGSGLFALCPVIVEGAVIGCLYCNRKQNLSGRGDTLERQIREMRDLAAKAIQKARAMGQPVST